MNPLRVSQIILVLAAMVFFLCPHALAQEKENKEHQSDKLHGQQHKQCYLHPPCLHFCSPVPLFSSNKFNFIWCWPQLWFGKVQISPTQEPEKTEKPWVGEHADVRKLTQAGLDEILREHILWCETRFNEEKKGKRANLSRAKLMGAKLSGADLVAANLSGAFLVAANLSEAELRDANLSEAMLFMANLSGAELRDANLSGANLVEANLSGAMFEPKPGSVSDVTLLLGIEGLDSLRYKNSPHGLLELRETYKKAGLRNYERQVTHAINRTRREKLIEGGFWGKLEGAFQYVFFELTCQYGMSPGRPLEILGVGLLVFTFPYLLALWSRDRETGIWLVLPPDRILGKGDKYPPYKLTHRPPFRPLPPGRWARLGARFKRFRRVLRLAFYFSLLSAFRLGWRELNVGNWISRLQKHEYILGATGWPRTVAGFQSLLSVYLVALWALTYFSRPFD